MPVTHRSGVKIAFEDCGQGNPALLFLPGWLAPRWVFKDLMALSAEHQRVLALDWRGHGESELPAGDFGLREITEDAFAVIESSGVDSFVPVASAHSGWVAIELARRFGSRVAGIVSLEWFMLGLPPQLRGALEGMQDPQRWQQVVDTMHARWRNNAQNSKIERLLELGASAGFAAWSRAGREVAGAFARNQIPFEVLRDLGIPVLHLYSQAPDENYVVTQQQLARDHSWFSTERLSSRTQFSMLEAPGEINDAIDRFLHARALPSPVTRDAL